MKEKDLEDLFRFSLRHWYPQRSQVYKHHADQYTGDGHPDFYGHLMGYYLGVELKVSPNRFTAQQTSNLTMLRKSGGSGWGLLAYPPYRLAKLEDMEYYLLYPQQVELFSLRNRDGWIRIPVVVAYTAQGHRPALDLRFLLPLVEAGLPKTNPFIPGD